MPEPLARDVPLGPYRIVSLLGAGGMGEVYLASDSRLSRNVAIKVLPRRPTSDVEAQRRMLREARMIATIDHPNVCTIYEIGEQDERPYIVMQYVAGETLADRMSRERLSLADTVHIARQIASALAEAHKHGIVHRDIKPGNIMLSESGVVKVLDFGLAKTFMLAPEDATEMAVSTPNLIAGTTPYMSPEQLLGEPLDGRSDVFSLGVVLYEIAAGRRPFDRRTAAATIHAILSVDPEPLGTSDLAALEPLIRRALAKTPAARFADGSEFHDALAQFDGSAAPSKHRVYEPGKSASTDPAAMKLYLRGRAQWNKRNPEAIRQAIALFQEAVEVDPHHANAYSGLADAYTLLGFLQVISPRDVIPKAKAAAVRAIELDSSLAEPHACLGYVAGMFDWDWPVAQRELSEAMRLNPEYALAPHWYGVLAARHSYDDALRHATRAYELDPLSPIIHTAIGIVHHLHGKYESALRLYRQVLDSEAAFAPAHYYIGLTYEQVNDFENAIGNLTSAAEIASRGGLFLGALGHCLGVSGRRDEALEVLHELEARSRERYVSPFNIMLVHLGLDDRAQTLHWLERAIEDKTASLWHTAVEPRFAAIRDDPPFRELFLRSGLLS